MQCRHAPKLVSSIFDKKKKKIVVVVKRKALTVAEKIEVLKEYDSNNNKLIKRKRLVKLLGIPDSSLRSIKSRHQIKKNAFGGAMKPQKVRARKYDELEKTLLQWYNQACTPKIPVNGPVLQSKAQEISAMLSLEFSGSNA